MSTGSAVDISFTTQLGIDYLGIVRNVKAPAPKLKADGATSFPMMVDGEFQFVGESADVEIATEAGVNYVYTDTETDPNAASSTVENGKIKVNGLTVNGATKTLKIAALEEDGSIGNVLTVVCRRVAIPTVTYPEGDFEYMAEKGEITIEKPTGVDGVYYSFLDDDPTSAKGTQLPANGKITLPSQEVGSTLKLNLVAKCGDTFGEVTTVKCRRVALAKPMVVGYTENFKLRTEGQYLSQKFYLDDFNPSSFKTANNENGIALQANHLLLNLQSAYTLTPDGTGPFVEAQVSTSDTPDTDGSWLQLTAPIEDYPKYLLFEEGDSFEQTYNFAVSIENSKMIAKTFFFNDRKECYLHLRAVTNARDFDGNLPEGTVTSEVTTLHIVKAKPAKPATPVVTEWSESFYYNHMNKEVKPSSMNALSSYAEPVILGTQLLLALGNHYGAAGEPRLQYQLATTAEPDAGTEWRTCDTDVKSTTQYNGKDLLLFQRENSVNINDLLFPVAGDGSGRRPADIYLHLRAVTTPDEDAYEFVASGLTSIHLHHTVPTAPSIMPQSPGDTKGTVTRFVNSISVNPEKIVWEGSQQLQYAFVKAEGAVWPGQQPEQWTDAPDGFIMNVECDGRMYARIWDPVYN